MGAVTPAYSATVATGNVISQNPTAGARVLPGTAVSLVVSQGPQPVPVPNVVGNAQADAQSAITGVGLTVGTVTQQFSDTAPEGSVISQDPVAGTMLLPGAPVNLVVSKGPASISSCDYFPLAVGNMWVSPGTTANNGSSIEVSDTFVVHGYQCWEMKAMDYSQPGSAPEYYYITYVNGWMYNYDKRDALLLLPLVSPDADRTYPQFFTPGVSFAYIYDL
jgi:hypothetical protein